MTDAVTPSARLQKMGFELPPYEVPEKEVLTPFVVHGDRILVSAIAPFADPEAPIPRLNQDANVEAEGFDPEDLSESHPMNRAMLGSRMATLRALSVAAHAAGGDIDRIAACVRASLAVRTGPNFERLGLVYMPVQRIMRGLFGTGPAFAVTGVAALPAAAPMLLETEFVLRHE
ncbi:hypothetical protein [Algicella marina]|uniref:RidA family protein n=1 Tax=Algicella marina TaxID=2683284 RepID=A0A6P1STM4_9RHOB|nr:hypothetical protein [Algicella marina]QHQ33778.1 hypothetical protein GO499_00590 [Algicella marina]